MDKHTVFVCLQITGSDIRPRVKWTVSLVIADGQILWRVYVSMYMLTCSLYHPREYKLAQRIVPREPMSFTQQWQSPNFLVTATTHQEFPILWHLLWMIATKTHPQSSISVQLCGFQLAWQALLSSEFCDSLYYCVKSLMHHVWYFCHVTVQWTTISLSFFPQIKDLFIPSLLFYLILTSKPKLPSYICHHIPERVVNKSRG